MRRRYMIRIRRNDNGRYEHVSRLASSADGAMAAVRGEYGDAVSVESATEMFRKKGDVKCRL